MQSDHLPEDQAGIVPGAKARIVERECVYEGWTTLTRVQLRMPDQAIVERHIEHHGSGIAVLPYDAERRTAILVSMPRAAVLDAGQADLLEVIAGGLDGEAAEVCARREALEEAGVRLGRLEPVGHVWAMPTISTEQVSLFLAPYASSDLVEAGGGSQEEHESIEVHEMDLALLYEMMFAGGLRDMKTLALVQSLFLSKPELSPVR